MRSVDPNFLPYLAGFDLDHLDAHDNPAYGIWADGRLAFFNQAWFEFARRNGADAGFRAHWTLGANLYDALPEVLREHYRKHYEAALASGEPWLHTYERSSPSIYRQFQQISYPLPERAGLLIVNALRTSQPHSAEPKTPDSHAYLNEHGLIQQCAYCRRVRRQAPGESWDWVPEWVSESPPNTSHGICPPCAGHHFA